MPSSLESLKKVALAPFVCLALSLAGCKTLKSDSEVQESTSTLQAVSDSQYILRLASYDDENSDSSQFTFEVCQKSSPNDGCAIAFLSSIGQPVLFTVREIDQYSESSAKAIAQFVKNNSELNDEVLAAAGGLVTYQVGTRLKGEKDFVDIKHLIQDRKLKEAQRAIATRKWLLSEKLGLQIDKSHHNAYSRGDLIKVAKPAKLDAHLKAHGHVYRQDFIDFFNAKYSKELIANKTTAEKVLHWALLHAIHRDLTGNNRPQIEFGMLVREYRKHLHGEIISDVGSNSDYKKAIKDIMHPAMEKEFIKYNKLREVADSVIQDSMVIGRDSLQEVLDFPLKPSAFLKKGLPGFAHKHTKSIGTSAVIHLMNFSQHKFPSKILRHEYLRDTAELDFMLHRRLPNTATTKPATKPTTKPATKRATKPVIEPFTSRDSKVDLGKTSDQAVKKVAKGVPGKRLAKRMSVFFVVIAGALTGAGAAKKIFGLGSSVDKDESIALRHPSLFEAGAETSPVESVQGIVEQLGEYLKASGTDIDYYCMPSGCQLLYEFF